MARIGVTGHSDLSPETAELVHRALRDALFPHAGAGLVGVTCLAEGADQIFARVVLDLGGRYEVILPAPDYREKRVKPHNLEDFDELLRRASSVRYLPFETSGREAYLSASKELISVSERLLAVWDGQAPRGPGGTADAVAHAREVGVPVEVIWPGGARRG